MQASPLPLKSQTRPAVACAIISASAALSGFVLPFALKPLQPPSEAAFPYVAIAASFVLNLSCLALALAWLPDSKAMQSPTHFAHIPVCLRLALTALFAHVGLWAAPVHHESLRVFLVLALLTFLQAVLLLTIHAASVVILGSENRAPKTICAIALCVASSALFWSKEPIERLPNTGGDGALYSGYLADAVMKFSPPMTVAAVWFNESDAARMPDSPTSRRFDLVKGQLTYGVWIGSYQAVGSPDILPVGMGGDHYTRREFAPGLALAMLAWAAPLLLLCGVLIRASNRR